MQEIKLSKPFPSRLSNLNFYQGKKNVKYWSNENDKNVATESHNTHPAPFSKRYYSENNII